MNENLFNCSECIHDDVCKKEDFEKCESYISKKIVAQAVRTSTEAAYFANAVAQILELDFNDDTGEEEATENTQTDIED